MSNNSDINEIKSKIDIVDVIGQVVELKRSGSNFKGLCPFHGEKTPSFMVSQEKQIFTCFGCHATGDVIEFVKKHYNLEFREALEKLATQYGIEMTYHGEKTKNKEEYYKINREAAIFYYRKFHQKENLGYKYMQGRGISPETIKTFGIGYGGDDWDGLYKYLKSKGYNEKIMLELGLISSKDGKYFDKFRKRVIFPIWNTTDKIIGFGGRVVGEGMPKYLNSSESHVFSKKNNLYGLNFTRKEITKEDRTILVEGYMDVIALYDKGIRTVAASLGTALTENQARILKRYSRNIVLAYDADEAGQQAASRGLEVVSKAGARGKVLTIPDEKDPDEYVKKYGATSFLKLADESEVYADYKIKKLDEKYNLDIIEEKIEFLKEIAVFLKELSPVERDIYVKKISRNYNVSEGAIVEEVGIITQTPQTYSQYEKSTNSNIEISTLEKELINILISKVEMIEEVKMYFDVFRSNEGLEIIKSIEEIYEEGKSLDTNKLLDMLGEKSQIVVNKIRNGFSYSGNEREVFEECKAKVEMASLKERAYQLQKIIDMLGENELEKIEDATAQLIEIQKKIGS